MAAPIIPTGMPRNPGTVRASGTMNAGSVLKLMKTWMIRERARVAKIVADKAWLAKDAKGEIDMNASLANLAGKIQDTSDDLTVFEVPAAMK